MHLTVGVLQADVSGKINFDCHDMPGTYFQTPQCYLVKQLRPHGLPD